MWKIVKRKPPKPENFGKLASVIWYFVCAVQHPVHGIRFLWRSPRAMPLMQCQDGYAPLGPNPEISAHEMTRLIALHEETSLHEARLAAGAKFADALERHDD